MSINRTKVSKMKAGTMESVKLRVQDITWSCEKLQSSLANQQKQEQRHHLIWRLMNMLHCIKQLDPGKFQEKTSPLKRWLEKVHLDRLLKEQPQSCEGEMERQEWPLRCWKVPYQAKTVLCFSFSWHVSLKKIRLHKGHTWDTKQLYDNDNKYIRWFWPATVAGTQRVTG